MSMITEPVIPPSPALELYRMTVDEYEQLAAAGILADPRIELINGYLVRKMTKKPKHVIVTERLRRMLEPLLGPGWHVRQEQPVRIPNFDEPEPDIAVVRGVLEDYENGHPAPGDVGLLVEVSEISLPRDKGEKLAAYSRGGVPVYWIVNLVEGRVEAYIEPHPDGRFAQRFDYRPGQEVPVLVEGIELGRIAVADLLDLRPEPSGGE